MLQVFVAFALIIFLLITLYIDVIKLLIPNTLYHEGLKIIPIVLLANICLGIYDSFQLLDSNQDGFITIDELSKNLDKITIASKQVKEGFFSYMDN